MTWFQWRIGVWLLDSWRAYEVWCLRHKAIAIGSALTPMALLLTWQLPGEWAKVALWVTVAIWMSVAIMLAK